MRCRTLICFWFSYAVLVSSAWRNVGMTINCWETLQAVDVVLACCLQNNTITHTPGLSFRQHSSRLCRKCLVRTPEKGHSWSPRICPPTLSAPSRRFGSNSFFDCESSVASIHTRTHEARPLRVKIEKKQSSVSIQTILVLFVGGYERNALEFSVANLLPFEQQRKIVS